MTLIVAPAPLFFDLLGVAGAVAEVVGADQQHDRLRRELGDRRLLQPPQDKAGQVELAFVVGLSGVEEAVAARIVVGEAIFEIDADLIAGGRDAGADDGDHAARFGAEGLHGGYGRMDDAVQRALPAGMGRADDPGLGIGQQDRGAVGGEDGARVLPGGAVVVGDRHAVRLQHRGELALAHLEAFEGAAEPLQTLIAWLMVAMVATLAVILVAKGLERLLDCESS